MAKPADRLRATPLEHVRFAVVQGAVAPGAQVLLRLMTCTESCVCVVNACQTDGLSRETSRISPMPGQH